MLAYYSLDLTDLTVVKPQNSGTSSTSFLPQGLSSQNYAITCVAYASDAYGDISNTTTKVAVYPIPASQLAGIVTSQLGLAMQTLNADAVSSVVGAATKSLNSVDCSQISGCRVKYNRQVCSYVANTCGPCLSGFIGAEGSSNSVCISLSSSSSSPLQLSLKSSAVGHASRYDSLEMSTSYIDGSLCRLNSECFSSFCFRGKCAISNKTI